MQIRCQLVGIVRWSVGSCHDDRSEEINRTFHAFSKKEAIRKARAIIREYHKARSHLIDYELSAELHIVKPIWRIEFLTDQSALPAVPARKARQAHFEEKRLS